MSAHPDTSSPDDSVILAQLRSDTAAWEREATRHHPERAALYATIALAKWLHTVAREAEVAGLVEEVEYHMTDAIGAAESYSPDRLRRAVADLRTALSRLARLAGGGA